jgi:hypothetical protein
LEFLIVKEEKFRKLGGEGKKGGERERSRSTLITLREKQVKGEGPQLI